jgi:hypothetical protein
VLSDLMGSGYEFIYPIDPQAGRRAAAAAGLANLNAYLA